MRRAPSAAEVELANRILALLRQHPNEPYTYVRLGRELDIESNKTVFRVALKLAREQALKEGNCITACHWERTVGANAMRYLPSPPAANAVARVRHAQEALSLCDSAPPAPGDDDLLSLLDSHIAAAVSVVEQLATTRLAVSNKIRSQQLELATLRRMVAAGAPSQPPVGQAS